MISPPLDTAPELLERVTVGVADLIVRPGANVLLATHPLGAGLGVALYDPAARVGGLLHCLLPDSAVDAECAGAHPGMFLDTGLAGLVAAAQALKSKIEDLRIYAAGGGEILDDSEFLNLGKCNRDALVRLLPEVGLRLHGGDLGGLENCSLQLNLATGEVRLKSSGQEKMKTLCKPSTAI
jgi:chemotaxis protein CheD